MPRLGTWIAVALLAAVVGGVAMLVRSSSQLPEQVTPIVWHREACAHCQMLIGEPGFAAQLVTAEGQVHSFDDPGCALRYLDEHAGAPPHRLWFHHAAQERWILAEEVAFVPRPATPMGFGLAAVDAASGELSLAQARAKVRALDAAAPAAGKELR